MKFYQWYSQALGGIVGIIACIYCYLNGDLLTYSNLDGNFDIISFNGILASYTLYPLCFLIFIMAIILSSPNISQQKIININITKINTAILYLTVLIGILGCGVYFIIPALLLLLKTLIYRYKHFRVKLINKTNSKIQANSIQQVKEHEESNDSSTQLLITKTEMAVELLNKNANINFITEVTGLSKDYIVNLKSKREETNKK